MFILRIIHQGTTSFLSSPENPEILVCKETRRKSDIAEGNCYADYQPGRQYSPGPCYGEVAMPLGHKAPLVDACTRSSREFPSGDSTATFTLTRFWRDLVPSVTTRRTLGTSFVIPLRFSQNDATFLVHVLTIEDHTESLLPEGLPDSKA